MNNSPLISVIMPSLNVAGYIGKCLESICMQTLDDLEIICLDAGSDDGTIDIINEYAKKDSRIKLIIADKRSYGYQVNQGIIRAKGEFISIVDTDDWIGAPAASVALMAIPSFSLITSLI